MQGDIRKTSFRHSYGRSILFKMISDCFRLFFVSQGVLNMTLLVRSFACTRRETFSCILLS
jgi:hypothetical protein